MASHMTIGKLLQGHMVLRTMVGGGLYDSLRAQALEELDLWLL